LLVVTCVHVYINITAMALECVTYDHDLVNWSKQLQHCNSHQEHATQLQHHNLGAWILHTKSTYVFACEVAQNIHIFT